MALKTAGTTSTTALKALQYIGVSTAEADLAAFCALCLDDVNVTHPAIPGTVEIMGILHIPNRAAVPLRVNDWLVVDPATGFPFVISAAAMAGADWTHS